MILNRILVLSIFYTFISSDLGCRDRSDFFRHDGGQCFEIPPWPHQPVEMDEHLERVRAKYSLNLADTRRQISNRPEMSNADISRYMDTVIGPFLDTYHRNIQNSYQLLTSKILDKIKEEINAAVKKKQQIFKELTNLADKLQIPHPLCDEERRSARTVANHHVAQVYACTEFARESITKMGKYAQEMISLTKDHMKIIMKQKNQPFESLQQDNSRPAQANTNSSSSSAPASTQDVNICLESLSKTAVSLGYELDLSLTNARRHNEQSCEKLTSCTLKAKKRTDESIKHLEDLMYQAQANTNSSSSSAPASTQDVNICLESLSKTAVSLGYELDLSLTNARRHNEQSCEKLTSCTLKAKKRTDESIKHLEDLMYQCVYS